MDVVLPDRFQWISLEMLRSNQVPIFVLDEWLQTLGVSSLKELHIPVIRFLIEKNKLFTEKKVSLSLIAQFINPHCKEWKKSSLQSIWYEWTSTFIDPKPLIQKRWNTQCIQGGWPTLSQPYILPWGMLYYFCIKEKIWLPPDVSRISSSTHRTLNHFTCIFTDTNY